MSLVDPRDQHVDTRLWAPLQGVDGEHRIPVCLTQRRDVQPSRSASTVKKVLLSEVQRMRENGAVEP